MKLEQRYSAGIVVIYDGKVLLGHSTGRGKFHSWGISKGGIEEGESNLEAAIRETEEEFGIKVPTKLIGKDEYTFVVTSRKYKYNKVVYYYIMEITDLSQIGLKTLDIPKSKLQLKEIDSAKFVGYRDAMDLIMVSQSQVITNLLSKGLI